jgi:hypothetical protein
VLVRLFFGAPEAFKALDKGFYVRGNKLIKEDIIRNTPIIYDLLPSRLYLSQNDNKSYITDDKTFRPWSYDEISRYIGENFNKELFSNSLEFQANMEESVGEYVDFYKIIGDGIPTLGGFRAITDKSFFGKESMSFFPEQVIGDGVVPLDGSAYEQGPNDTGERTWYYKRNHEYLLNMNSILESIDYILQGNESAVRLRNEYQGFEKLKITIFNKAVDDKVNLNSGSINKEEESELPFGDISKDTWYYDDVNKAYTVGLIKGVSQDRFAPKDKATRAEAVVMLKTFLDEIRAQN